MSVNAWNPPYYKFTPALSKSSVSAKSVPPQPAHCSSTEQEMVGDISSSAQDLICDDHDTATDDIEKLHRFKKTPAVSSFERSDTDNVQNPNNTFSTHKNVSVINKTLVP